MKAFFLLFILAVCSLNSFSQGVIKLNNSSTHQVSFVKYDEFGNYQYYPINPGKTIEISTDLPYLNILSLEDGKNVPYFFFPGDDVTIGGVTDNYYQFNSLNKQRNAELGLSTILFQSFNNRAPEAADFLKVLQLTFSRIDSTLAAGSIQANTSPFANLLHDYYKYEMMGRQFKKITAGNNVKTYHDFWEKPFNRALQSYILTFRTYVLRYLPNFIDRENLLPEYSKIFSGEFKELALYTSMHMAYYRDKDWFRSQYTTYNSLSADVNFSEKISYFKLTDEVNKKSGEVILINSHKDTILLKDVLSKLKGKVVLIDLWASWCVPCMAQLPYSKELSASLKEKPFQVLYLSLDREFHLYARSSIKNLPDGLNYNVVGNFESSFAVINKVKSIPRYLLVDKQGNIVSSDTPHPGDEELKTLIERYL